MISDYHFAGRNSKLSGETGLSKKMTC